MGIKEIDLLTFTVLFQVILSTIPGLEPGSIKAAMVSIAKV